MLGSSRNALSAVAVLAVVVAAAQARLQFRADGTFHVVQLTDMHFGSKESDTQSVQSVVLGAEKPDLTVVTGDLVDLSAAQRMRDHWDTAVATLQKSGAPYAATMGNHDTQIKGTTRLDEASWDMTHKGSLTQMMYNSTMDESYANYYLPVYGGAGDDVAALIWMFDSCGSGTYAPGCQGKGTWPCVPEDVVGWFADTSAKLNQGRAEPIPAFLFTHVPTIEFDEVWERAPCLGTKDEGVCYPSINTGLYQTAAKVGGVKAIFAGHDHSNDYCGALPEHPELQLCYGRKTGLANYNSPTLKHGGRVIELSLNSTAAGGVSWNSWIREDDGGVAVQEWHNPSKKL